jgi:hypothetical protein
MTDEKKKDESLNVTDDQAFLDDLDALKIEFLDLSAPVSNSRRSDSIEDIRERVANSERTIRIGDYNGQKRIVLQRNTVRLKIFTVPVEAQALTDDQVREWVRRKIRRGDFDYEITTLYHEKWSKLKH